MKRILMVLLLVLICSFYVDAGAVTLQNYEVDIRAQTFTMNVVNSGGLSVWKYLVYDDKNNLLKTSDIFTIEYTDTKITWVPIEFRVVILTLNSSFWQQTDEIIWFISESEPEVVYHSHHFPNQSQIILNIHNKEFEGEFRVEIIENKFPYSLIDSYEGVIDANEIKNIEMTAADRSKIKIYSFIDNEYILTDEKNISRELIVDPKM